MKEKVSSLVLAIVLCASACGLNGCSLFTKPSIPATSIKFNPKTDALNIQSPKDVTIQSVVINKSNTNFSMTVNGYSSTNNAALVGVVVTAQAAIASNASVTINNLSTLANQAVSKIP